MSNMLRSYWSICVLEFPRLFVVSGLQPSNSLVFFSKCQQSNPRGVFFGYLERWEHRLAGREVESTS